MLEEYLKKIHKTFSAGATTERSFYPDLKNLLEDFLLSKNTNPNITIEAKKTKAGIPDFTICKSKELIGYIYKYNLVG